MPRAKSEIEIVLHSSDSGFGTGIVCIAARRNRPPDRADGDPAGLNPHSAAKDHRARQIAQNRLRYAGLADSHKFGGVVSKTDCCPALACRGLMPPTFSNN